MHDTGVSIRCDACPIRDTCDAHTFFTGVIYDLFVEISDLRLELEAAKK